MPARPDENGQRTERTTFGQFLRKARETLRFRKTPVEGMSVQLTRPEGVPYSGYTTPYDTMPSVEPGSPAKETVGDVADRETKSSLRVQPEKNEEIGSTRDSRELERPNQEPDEKVIHGRVRALKESLEKRSSAEPVPSKDVTDVPITQGTVNKLADRFRTAPPEPERSNGVTDAPITKGNVKALKGRWDAIETQNRQNALQHETKGGHPGKAHDKLANKL